MSAKQLLVVGAGFAGLEAVAALRRRAPDAEVTLIDANSYATMVPALPDIVSGRIPQNAFATPLSEVVDPAVRLVQDRIEAVDLKRRVLSGGKESYNYELLILAAGSKPNFFGFEPEGGTLHSVHSYPAALSFRHAFEEKARSGARPEVVIVGGGYTGLEVAASLRYGTRESGVEPRIRIVELAEEIVTFLPEKIRRRIKEYLQDRQIELLTGTSLERLVGETAHLSNGERVENALVCWSAGMRASQDEVEGNVARARDGRLETNEFLQLPEHPEVFVAGDAAALKKEEQPLRRAVNFSIYSGRRAGMNAAALVGGERLRPFKPVDLGWVIPLSEISTGRVLGSMPVGGSLGLRLHYFMCGFRHWGARRTWEFYRTAARLSRKPGSMEL